VRGRRNIVNTDQAFDLLIEAGVTEDTSIQTVRRWYRERKITYKGAGQDSGYILENTDQAFHLLKDAGVATSTGVQIVRRLLREGKIQNVGTGNKETTFQSSETASKRETNRPSEQDIIVRQLKAKIKAQDEHIIGLEQLHQSSIATLIQQIDIFKKDIVNLEKEQSELQRETNKLLKENIDLTNVLIKLKGELFKGNKSNSDQTDEVPLTTPITNEYRQKLGLSKMASDREVLSKYKKLLKITHPDHGGNASAFHFIKSDYDHFRNSINMK
jgi:hypothetical protein